MSGSHITRPIVGREPRAGLKNTVHRPRPYHLRFLHVCVRLAKAENTLDKKANIAQQTVSDAQNRQIGTAVQPVLRMNTLHKLHQAMRVSVILNNTSLTT